MSLELKKNRILFFKFLVFASLIFFYFYNLTESKIRLPIIFNLDTGYGGSIYFIGLDSLGGKIDFECAQGLRLSENLSLLPYYHGLYSGIKQLVQLQEGGFLFQEKQDHNLQTKILYDLSENLILKAKLGYIIELLKEVKNENWGEGLYDYDEKSIGLEIEKDIIKTRWRAGLTLYSACFPNYSTLGYGFGYFQPGKKIYNSKNADVLFTYERLLTEKISAECNSIFTYKDYDDNYIVDRNGNYSSDRRKDFISRLGIKLIYNEFPYSIFQGLASLLLLGKKFKRTTCILEYNFTWNESNQNFLDARTITYVPNFYDFVENKITSTFIFYFSEPPSTSNMNLYYSYTRRDYLSRPIQSVTGGYGTEKMNSNTHSFGIGIMTRFIGSINLFFSLEGIISVSNMKYETIYRYNYWGGNFFIGLNYSHR